MRFHDLLDTASTNERGVEPQTRNPASVKAAEMNVTFDAPGVNFYLRLGAIGKQAVKDCRRMV